MLREPDRFVSQLLGAFPDRDRWLYVADAGGRDRLVRYDGTDLVTREDAPRPPDNFDGYVVSE